MLILLLSLLLNLLVAKINLFKLLYLNSGASLVGQLVKNLPTMQDTQVRFPGREDSLEKEITTHPSILAWRIPWTEEPDRLQSMGLEELDTT